MVALFKGRNIKTCIQQTNSQSIYRNYIRLPVKCPQCVQTIFVFYLKKFLAYQIKSQKKKIVKSKWSGYHIANDSENMFFWFVRQCNFSLRCNRNRKL